MVIGNYVYSPIEQCAGGGTCCFVRPNFEPRKVNHNGFDADLTAGRTRPGVETLTPEQKADLKNKLRHGRGGLSLQEWDDFLADLEEYGIISHDERFYANGTLHDIPADALNGGTHFSHGNTSKDIAQMWKGDPVSWLDNMDVYMLKNQLYANLSGQYTSESGGQREAFRKLAQITRTVLM